MLMFKRTKCLGGVMIAEVSGLVMIIVIIDYRKSLCLGRLEQGQLQIQQNCLGPIQNSRIELSRTAPPPSFARATATGGFTLKATSKTTQGRMALPNRMNFRKSFKEGGWERFQSKNLYCRFWTFIQGFKQGISFSEKMQYKFPKMGGSKAVWIFSDN